MPITQDRLISLIHIVDQALSSRLHVEAMVQIELDAAIEDFYSRDGNSNLLASDLLSRLQSVKELISQPSISHTAIETLAREREHFRAAKRSNDRAARAMRNRRNREVNDEQS